MTPANFFSFLHKTYPSLPLSHRLELLEFVFSSKHEDLLSRWQCPASLEEEEKGEQVKGLLEAHTPVAYITGSVLFCDCKISVSKQVLIPRPETEELVENIANRLTNAPAGRLVDLCTGSGCIAVALKKKLPQFSVVATDISLEALDVARENAENNDVEVEFRQGDLEKALSSDLFSVVTCNPPYISQEEYQKLDPGVRLFEPELALVAKKEGLAFYERLARDLPPFLKRGAKLFFEIGSGQADALKKIFSAPHWKKLRIEKDAWENDRFFFLEFE